MSETETDLPPAVTVIVCVPDDSIEGIVAEALSDPSAAVLPDAITVGVEAMVTVKETVPAKVPAAQETEITDPGATEGGVTVHPPVGGYCAAIPATLPPNTATEQIPSPTTHRNSRTTIATFRSAHSDTLRGHSTTESHK